MRLTDEQVREIEERARSGKACHGDRLLLLADREALVAEIAELKTRMAEGFAARAGQIENGAKMIAKLRAENAKLRRVVEADFKLFHAKEYGTLNEHQQALRMRADALADLEPPNVPDAKND